MYRVSRLSTVLVATIVVAASALPVHAAGYYNMPTSMQQCLGLGYGPGYHAPLLLSRSYKARIATQRVQRLPAPLSPPYPSSFGAASHWTATCETGGCVGSFPTVGAYAPIDAPRAGNYAGESVREPASGYGAATTESPSAAFAPPPLVVPQQATGPFFPSARAPQNPPLLW